MKKTLAILAFSTLGSAFCAINAQTTQRFTADKTNEYALVYSLPLTVVDITIETEHTVRTPGQYNNYAMRYLSLDDGKVIRQSDHTVAVKSVTITPRGTADPENRWQVQFKPGSTPTMLLNPDGVPLAINLEEDDIDTNDAVRIPTAKAAAPTALETPAALQAITQAMTQATTPGKKAEATAARIFELRERRSEIYSGDADAMPPDGQATKLILDGLEAQEAALTAMFIGTTQTYTEVTTVTFTPGRDDQNKVLLARISPTQGIVARDDLSGIPLYLSYQILSRGHLPVNDKGETKKFPKGGVAYTIPGSAHIALTFEGATIGQADIDVAQLGATFGIDPALFTDKKTPAYIEFSPVTGAVTRLGTLQQ